MSSGFAELKKNLQSKLSELRIRRKTVVQAFKKKAEAKKIERIRESI